MNELRMKKYTLSLFVLAAIAGYSYVISVAFKPYDLSYALKASPVLLLALIAFLFSRDNQNSSIKAASGPLSKKESYVYILAMLGSASGDIFLDFDRALYLKQALASFLLTQIAYIVLFYPRTVMVNRSAFNTHSARFRLALIPILFVLTGYLLSQFYQTAGALFIPVLIYCALLLTMACMALLVNNNPWINLGGLLFLIADALIGINRFILVFDYSTYIIVLLYISAQLLIAWGLLFHPRQA